jgi:formylglycine-generating enzyme
MVVRRAKLLLAAVALGTGACSALFDVSSLGSGGPDSLDASSPSDGSATGDGQVGADAPSLDGSPRPEGGPPLDAGGDAPAVGEGGCPIGQGPAMIRGLDVCVDATEVTEGQYLTFMQSDAGKPAPSQCSWNVDFTPTPHDGNTYTWPPGAGEADYPIQYVDWCDAFTYCAWAGKQLCGAVKSGDSIDDYHTLLDASASQWYQGCSHDGDNDQPYPGPFADVCVLGLKDGGGPQGVAPVATFPGCQGGYAGIFDMVGNVTEWIDSCPDPGPGSDCAGFGGNAQTLFAGAGCFQYEYYARNLGYARLGFRCCARPAP